LESNHGLDGLVQKVTFALVKEIMAHVAWLQKHIVYTFGSFSKFFATKYPILDIWQQIK
jgi:hypothetical protein